MKQDVDGFQKAYGTVLDDELSAGSCDALYEIVAVYRQRVFDRGDKLAEIVMREFDFSRNEVFYKAEERDYAASEQEWDELWRQYIKLQYLPYLPSMTMADIRQKIMERYDKQLQGVVEVSKQSIHESYLKSFAAALDSHTSYFTPFELEEVKIKITRSYAGIGVLTKLKDGFAVIEDVIPGGPAFKAGVLRSGDKILSVGQEDGVMESVVGVTIEKTTDLIRGEEGSTVYLVLSRQKEGTNHVIKTKIVRRKVDLSEYDQSVGLSKRVLHVKNEKGPGVRVGLITMPTFYWQLSVEFLESLKFFEEKNVDVVVVDLRYNRGGLLHEAQAIASYVLSGVAIQQIKDSSGKVVKVMVPRRSEVYDGPLVVLGSLMSASGSEIFMGAVKDHNRGLILGDTRTFGKGTIQRIPDPSTVDKVRCAILKLVGDGCVASQRASQLGMITIAQFFTPSGSSNQIVGVAPHIEVPTEYAGAEEHIGEKNLPNPLPWDEVSSAVLKDYGFINDSVISTLKQLSSQRRRTVSELQALGDIAENNREEIAQSKAFVSLKYDSSEVLVDESAAEDVPEEDASSDAAATTHLFPRINEDPTLWEALYISADYVDALQGRLPASYGAIMEVSKPSS